MVHTLRYIAIALGSLAAAWLAVYVDQYSRLLGSR